MNEVVCDCGGCRAMCANSSCVPTPDEVRALLAAGYGARLRRYRFRNGVEVVAPRVVGSADATTTVGGPCTFYTGAGCALHARGLKPFEGRIARHDRSVAQVRAVALDRWPRTAARRVLKEFDDAIDEEGPQDQGGDDAGVRQEARHGDLLRQRQQRPYQGRAPQEAEVTR